MRKMISGLVAAVAVMTAAPAMACGGLFGGCSPCGQEYVSPCAQQQFYQPQVYQAPVYVAPAPTYTSGCNSCGWAHERLPDPVHQYYYVNQGPTYTGPGNFAPQPTYEEGAISNWGYYHHRPHYYGYHRPHHYGYRYGYAPRHMRYGMMPYHYWHHQHTLRRYY
jgi:hypothetical protein